MKNGVRMGAWLKANLALVACLAVGGVGTLSAVETTEIDVSAGGALAAPVVLHVDTEYAAWLAQDNWYDYASRHGNGVTEKSPQPVVRLVWGDAGRSLVYSNLCVGATYEWHVTKNDGTELSGSFTTEAAAPRVLTIPVANDKVLRNVRDLGGWPLMGVTKDGRTTTKQGVIFRGGNPDDFFDGEQLARSYWREHTDVMEAVRAGNRLHTELGIKSQVDLRNESKAAIVEQLADVGLERFYYGDPKDVYPYYPEAVEVNGKQTFTHSPSCPDIKYYLMPMTEASLSKWKTQLRRVFQVFGKAENLPSYFHCRIGRDRTGLVALLLNALVGVDEPSLYRDYLSSNFGWVGDAGANGYDLDQHIKDLYRGSSAGAAALVHGKSLAGCARAYLESIGVTQEELATITMALTGETPDEVLARVDAYEAANEYVTVKFMNNGATPGLHRLPRAAFATFPPTATVISSETKAFLGWSEPTLQSDGTYLSEPMWENKLTVCFTDAFGALLGTCLVDRNGSAAGHEPAAPQGTRITGWDVDYTHVVSNMTVRAVMEGLDGYVGQKGELVTDEKVLARGGDEVRQILREMTVDYVHVFRDPAQAKTFVNNTGHELDVSYLVVGGGGAGGDQLANNNGVTSDYIVLGGGGGGGGGVVGRAATLAANETWTIQVGAGGQSPKDRYLERIPAGASSIMSGDVEVARAPGGGGGGSGSSTSSSHPGQNAQAGAAGGGAHTYGPSDAAFAAGAGTFASVCDGVEYGIHAGGVSGVNAKVRYEEINMSTYPSGGGGGAGADAYAPFTTHVGSGGLGVYSSITGELACYGAGGGAGGGYSTQTSSKYGSDETTRRISELLASIGLPNGIGEGFGGANGGAGGYYWEGTWILAQNGTDGFGGGGGGATWNGGKATSGSAHTSVAGGNGGSGVVIVRYSQLRPDVTYMPGVEGNDGEVTFTGNAPDLILDALGNVYIRPGTTATLAATDAGGCVVSAWRNETTGELMWGATVTVTPTEPTAYTALFGRRWIWNSKTTPPTLEEETDSDDKWVFDMAARDGNKLVFTAVRQARSDGYLNLATPVVSIGGGGVTAYYPYKLADSLFKAKDYPTSIVFASQGVRIESSCFNNNKALRGTLCFPRDSEIRSYTFRDCSNIERIVFADAANGSINLSATGYQFYNTTGVKGTVVLPATVKVDGSTSTPLPDRFLCHTGASAIDASGVLKFAVKAISGCANLTNVVLSASVQSIGLQAFSENPLLASVTPLFPATLCEVGTSAFEACPLLAGDAKLDGVVDVGTNAFYNCKFTSLSLANDETAPTLRREAFHDSPLTNVVFGTTGVVLDAYNRQFYKCEPGCRFWFPGAAPTLPPTTLSDGTVAQATGNYSLFGTTGSETKYPRLYGNWKADKAGWEKILAEVGGSVADAGTAEPTVEKGQRVRGTFSWLYSKDKTAAEAVLFKGWLIDYGPQAPSCVMILIH